MLKESWNETNIGNYNCIDTGCMILNKIELGDRNVIRVGVVLNKKYLDKTLVRTAKSIEEKINLKHKGEKCERREW